MALTNFTGGPSDSGNNGNTGGNIPIHVQPNGAPNGPGIDITEFCTNYNKRFKNGLPAKFRNEVVQQTLSVLIGKTKPNPLLIGPAGSGKTKIVEDIAWRLANDDPILPDSIKGFTIWELPLNNIIAGAVFRGQMEENIKSIIEYASDPKNKAIIFIDEIHQLMTNHSLSSIAQILKPELARGNVRVIGATTVQEANKMSEDPAFNRRFTRVIVDELSRAQTVEIMHDLLPTLLTHYGSQVFIKDEMIELCAVIADDFSSAGSHRPDNAITLLDRAFGTAIIERRVLENTLTDPVQKQAFLANPMIPITEKLLRTTAIQIMTGSNKKDDVNMQSLSEKLSVIKGQDKILQEIMDIIRHDNMGLFPRTKPLTLLFAGSSGVGKTEVTKIIALEMTGVKPIILNMTEYHDSAAINRIIGAPPGYAGCDSNAELPFDCLDTNPYQIILLDEFEKADRSVQRLFMSAFDEGTMRTNNNKLIDFSKAIIIATTNAAHKEAKKHLGFNGADDTQTASASVHELGKWFDTELLNRFQHIFTFNSLSKDVYREIVVNQYHKDLERIRANTRRINLPDDIPDDELDEIINSTYVQEFGARPATKAVRKYIESKI